MTAALSLADRNRREDHRGALVGAAVFWPDPASGCSGWHRGRPMMRSANSSPRRNARLRCAIYTRKSSKEGLEQEFNSLQAQREARLSSTVNGTKAGCVCPRLMTMPASPTRRWIAPLCKFCAACPPQLSHPGHHASHPRRAPAGRFDRRQAAGTLTPAAGLARSTERARFCLSRSRLCINIPESRAAQTRLAAVPPPSRTASATMRYRNIARQRHYRPSARCCWTLRVSVDRAARPSPHTRGKPRLLDVGRRILARDRFAPDSPLEVTGFEPVWGFSCQVVVFGLLAVLCSERESRSSSRRLRSGSRSARKGVKRPKC